MARQSTTDCEYRCRLCGEWIRDREYANHAPLYPERGRWHYNCKQPRLNPDIHGFPSRKESQCSFGYKCKRPHNTTLIRIGDMIIGVGTNKFAHIECTGPRRASKDASTDNATDNSASTDASSADSNSDNTFAKARVDTFASETTQAAETAQDTTDETNQLLKMIVAEFGNFVERQNKRSDEAAALIASQQEAIINLQSAIADLQERRPITVSLFDTDTATTQTRDIGYQHKAFPTLLKLAKRRDHRGNRINIMLSGPPGASKSYSLEVLAEILGLEFRSQEQCAMPSDLTGYVNPGTGEYVHTAFSYTFMHGGVCALEEMDSWNERALLRGNNPLANGIMYLPGLGQIKRHPDALFIANLNTWGFGGGGNLVGRAKLDVTSLERFFKLEWAYDEALELHILGTTSDPLINSLVDKWYRMVVETRHAAQQAGAQIVISPRASINGAMLIRAREFTREEIVASIFDGYRKSREFADDWRSIGRAFENWVAEAPHEIVGFNPDLIEFDDTADADAESVEHESVVV